MEAERSARKHRKQDEPWLEGAASITNRFVALKVGDSSDVYPSEVPEVAAAVNMTQKTKASNREPVFAVYQLEDEAGFVEDLAFIMFCQCRFISRLATLMLTRFLRGPSSYT